MSFAEQIIDLSKTIIPIELMDNEILQEEIADMNLVYTAAIREVTTKLEVLSDDFKTKFGYSPVHHIDARLKSFDSMIKKAKKYGIDNPIENLKQVREEVFDIAGIRVVCNYRNDMYTMADLITRQKDVTLILTKDYCKKPKESGYRSLHVIVLIPVFLVEKQLSVPVEIQFRSIAMDAWASLEHELKYKNTRVGCLSDSVKAELKQVAKTLEEVDEKMEHIRAIALDESGSSHKSDK